MISDKNNYREGFVWIWLPGETEPVVAGKLTAQGKALVFNYGQKATWHGRMPLRSMSQSCL